MQYLKITLLEISVCDLSWLNWLLALLIPFLLGYLLRHFFGGGKNKQEIAALKSENTSLHADLKKAKSMKVAVAAPVMTVDKSELNSLKDRVRDLDAHNSKLKSDMAEYVSFKQQFAGVNVDSLKSKIADLENKEAKLLSEIDAQKALNASLNTSFTHASTDDTVDVDLLKSNLNNAQNEVSRLTAQMNAVKYERDNIIRENDSINNLRNDVRELSGKVGALTVENERLKASGGGSAPMAAKLSTTDNTAEMADLKEKLLTAIEAYDREKEMHLALQAKFDAAAPLAAAHAAPVAEPVAVPVVEEVVVPVAEPVAESVAAPVVEAVTESAAKDDLTKIEGIGPKIAELCNGIGIFTFTQLSETPLEKLQAMLAEAGPRYQMHNPASWAQQAALAAAGNWDELKTLQDALNGGIAE